MNETKLIDLSGDPNFYVGESKIDKYRRLKPDLFEKYSNII